MVSHHEVKRVEICGMVGWQIHALRRDCSDSMYEPVAHAAVFRQPERAAAMLERVRRKPSWEYDWSQWGVPVGSYVSPADAWKGHVAPYTVLGAWKPPVQPPKAQEFSAVPEQKGRFVVRTRDVDGSTSRTYKSRRAAVHRFEEMVGYSMAAAIGEHYHTELNPPSVATVRSVRAVSNYGTVVIFEQQ